MSSPNTVAVALQRDLHHRMKRIFGAMTLSNTEPPSIVEFVNHAVALHVSKLEKKYGVRPAA
jgi:hypothetical protein